MIKPLTNSRLTLIAQAAAAVASAGSYMGSPHSAGATLAVAVLFSGLIGVLGWVSYQQERNDNCPWADPLC